jgi:SAM-dependent methyltransferase
MECGTGNGTLLLSFLTSPSSSEPQRYHLTGTDYSSGSIILAQEVEASQRKALEEGDYEDDEEVLNDVTTDWREVDLLRHDFEGEKWDLVLDKGTFDALCLSQDTIDGKLPSQVYPEQMAKLVNDGGFFLITSCNFTEEEIKARWAKEELGLEFQYVPLQLDTFSKTRTDR